VAGPSASPVQSHSPVQQRSKTTEAVPQRVKSPVNPQDLVFQLLGRTKPVQEEQPSPATPEFQEPKESSPVAEQPREGTPQKQPSLVSSMPPPPPIDSSIPPSHTPLSAAVETPLPSQTPNKGLFTYVNPFEQLAATNPRNRTKTGTPAKNVLGTNETKAENVPLPESKPVSPPTPADAEAARDAATVDQVKRNEQQLMEQLDQHASEVARTDSAPETMVEDVEDVPEPSASLESPTTVADGSAPQSNGSVTVPDVKSPGDDDDDGYESAPENQPIEVYNFPMKPFSAITIVPSAIRRVKYPSVKYQDIARMTRTFDQLDRNLIAASHAFIAYAMSKSNNRGGIRIIRQFDGKDRVLMKDSPDRTFNVTIGKGERLLGTGISGAVVWVELMEDFEAENWNTMFVFPPSEEQGQSNGVLKSRARKTSRLADVFAIGRGKTISIIHAPTAKHYADSRKHNEVASKRYLADHARTIDTGKASKDFAFSDDDSVIISIDKAGKLKLWDVQGLLNYSENDAYDTVQKAYLPQPPIVISTPTLVFSAVAAGESYRATSVMFLDKFRPYLKCLALRYVVVGMKQNHTLQLWDLALGRPVQEINFPQESDTDALCSVVYHPLSGIIVVGNPTRNSIYFIHLSAPKYNLPTMSQAQYIKGLATKDPSIPKPDATAILSGLREYSFASKGQLMSIDILDCEADPQEDNPVLFELYVAHSKGMTSLSVYKEDLGWEPDNRVKNAVDAVAKGVCTLSSLPPPPPPEKERDDKSETAEIPAQTLKPKSEKEKSRSVSPAPQVAEKSDAGDIPGVNGAGKRKKKANATASTTTTSGMEDQPKGERAVPVSGKAKAPPTQSTEQETSIGISSGFIDRELKKIEKSVSAEFTKVIGRELESLCE
jgi:WD40 repeat protein